MALTAGACEYGEDETGWSSVYKSENWVKDKKDKRGRDEIKAKREKRRALFLPHFTISILNKAEVNGREIITNS